MTGQVTVAQSAPIGTADTAARREIVVRHSLLVRAAHWLNVLFFVLLLMSGLRILNAHPALYWGNYGYTGMPAFIAITAEDSDVAPSKGITTIGDHSFETTGILGLSYGSGGEPLYRAFPRWATLPADGTLGEARGWHFLLAWAFAANGAIYLLLGFINGHFVRDIAPRADELRPRRLVSDVWNHLRLRRARGEEARRYNPLQKLTYLAVIFLLLPVMILSGLTMSPAVTSLAPFLFDLFGGRQSARTIHFITANLLVAFIALHVIEVMLSRPVQLMRSMITGRFAVEPEQNT